MLAARNESYQGTTRGAMIFLHGSGDSGPGCEAWINHVMPEFLPRLRSAGIVVVFPSAPVRAYSLIGGAPSAVWFDRKALALDAPEDSKGIAETALQIRKVVQNLQEEHPGLVNQHIVLGGFSMGGATALATGLSAWLDDENNTEATEAACVIDSPGVNEQLPNLAGLAGIFSISSWLSTQSSVWPKLEAARARQSAAKSARSSSSSNSTRPSRLPPLFLGHGSADTMIPHAWGADTKVRLSSHMDSSRSSSSSGSEGRDKGQNSLQWVLEPHVGHEPGPQVLAELLDWTLRALPPAG